MTALQVHNHDTAAITDLGAYKRNLLKILAFTGSKVGLLAVVKSNAYGHGMVECARTALDAGAVMLGVAFFTEGVKLRKAGITAPILILVPESSVSPELYFTHNLTLTVTSFEMLERIGGFPTAADISCKVHINVDTGMGRVGIHPEKAVALTQCAFDVPGLEVEGIYSHFPSADEDSDDYSLGQVARFEKILAELAKKGIRPPLAHMCNSAGTLKFPQAHFDLVRPGIMTYGLIPYPGSVETLELEPVMSFVSRIGFIKEVPAGTPVSYGGTHVTKRTSRLATVPVGYGDGFNRHLSGRGRALINGVYVLVRGRVCMDQTVFDITDAGNVGVGDTITLFGRDGDKRITVEEHAEIAGTISHEIVTGITGRVSRTFKTAT